MTQKKCAKLALQSTRDIPLQETIQGFHDLIEAGYIRYWGVSNFDFELMQELVSLPEGASVTTNQVMYNPNRRGIEWDLLPWCKKQHIPIMAYSPMDQGALAAHPALVKIAARHDATPGQVVIAWLVTKEVCIIPKASRIEHVKENHDALLLKLDKEDLARIDKAFPPPNGPLPLATA